MTWLPELVSRSKKSGLLFLCIGTSLGVIVGGGVGVIAASSPSTVTVCANKKTSVLRYAKNGKCRKTETRVLLNQASASSGGSEGSDGLAGATGATGAKGDTGATGATGATGSKGDTGSPGSNGINGSNGSNGINATVAITQLSVCDSSDDGTIANELCKIGMTGPGGGVIFFIDYNDQYEGFNYLEAAPMGWANGITVAENETLGNATDDPLLKWCPTATELGIKTWEKSSVGSGASNTATAANPENCASGASRVADAYSKTFNGVTKDDWFLPSVGEAMLMYENLRQVGKGGFSSDDYWTSTEFSIGFAWRQDFVTGYQVNVSKAEVGFVRPARRFQ